VPKRKIEIFNISATLVIIPYSLKLIKPV